MKRRVEDGIIAWTWKEFLANGSNPEILLRLPMTKVSAFELSLSKREVVIIFNC